jgi:hypothetical protein
MKYADGIYDNISIEDYHASEGYSATSIKQAKKSLKHFDSHLKGKLPKSESPALSFGNAFELALLSPNEYLQRVAVFPDKEFVENALIEKPDLKVPRNSAYYKKASEEWIHSNRGKYVINDAGEDSFETIEEMLSSCYQDKYIQGLIKNTEYQLSLYWTDPETGLQLKTRPDFVKRKKNIIVNLKTTTDGSPEGFMRDMVKWDYPLQAIIETTGCLATGLMDKVDNYFWLVVEKVAPFNATIYEFSPEDMSSLRMTLEYNLSKIKKAQDANLWPGYSQEADNEYGILTAKLPSWYRL